MITEQQVYDALHEVYDPELGLNIVDLGLVYGVVVEGTSVDVTMTMTTPGCPMHEAITVGAREALSFLPGVEQVNVQLVWFPPWDPGMMSESARQELWG